MSSLATAPENAHIYRPSEQARGRFRFAGCLIGSLGPLAALLFRHNLTVDSQSHSGALSETLVLTMIVTFLAPLAEGIILFRAASRLSLVITDSDVEVTGLVDHTILPVAEIRGKRRVNGKNSTWTVLIPQDKQFKKLIIKGSYGLAFDDFYNNWLASIPDLDAIDLEQRRKEGKLHFWES